MQKNTLRLSRRSSSCSGCSTSHVLRLVCVGFGVDDSSPPLFAPPSVFVALVTGGSSGSGKQCISLLMKKKQCVALLFITTRS